MNRFNITETNKELESTINHKIDFKTKPLNSLGILEKVGKQVCLIQQTLTPSLSNPEMLIFAGDHGITASKSVSPFPQEVTAQMVLNFLNGGAAINVFCKLNDINLSVIDAGVNFDFPDNNQLINAKIAKGTKNYSIEPAMSVDQCNKAINEGAKLVEEKFKNGCNIIGFGEMGIGNTSSAALLMSAFTGISIEDCVGKGTGLDENGVNTKKEILKSVQELHGVRNNPLENLQIYGGFEIAMMTGAILKAAELKMTMLIDGFIVTSALLAAHAIDKNVLDYCLFSHNSNEQGHVKMLAFLNATPILQLDLRLGEGTGAALAYPLVKASVAFINEMASFESAGVSNK